LGLSD